ncbi:hypothetical protein NEOLI_004943 [Neolecta irregularis DAH-3]|uniref:Uncharacterized protein n=1 Tax=Neolecta irregularis (strain DAH-3) TaxID=1198029 RepID=A0A1U7LLU0_NEOID|nr:hypothetical protein NEOLI_004943 [Neolecta irregularis DAH-3]|eukprot:OLL23481.1 hypothetical protein NEOLI_004943 [Neolecta irregularis DAH-3]
MCLLNSAASCIDILAGRPPRSLSARPPFIPALDYPQIHAGAILALSHFAHQYARNAPLAALATPEYAAHLAPLPRPHIALRHIHSAKIVYDKPRIGDPRYWAFVQSRNRQELDQLHIDNHMLFLLYLPYATALVHMPQLPTFASWKEDVYDQVSTIQTNVQQLVDVKLDVSFDGLYGRRDVYVRLTTDWKNSTWYIADIDYLLESTIQGFLDEYFSKSYESLGARVLW